MKAKVLRYTGLPLLLLVLALICPVQSAAQANPPLTALINGPIYDPAKNVYNGSFSVSDAQAPQYLIYTVEDADAGTVTIPDTQVNLGGFSSRSFQLDGARFKPEGKYLLKVKAVDWSGNLIPRVGDNFTQNTGDQYTLASKEFTHQPPAAANFDFKINAVNADYQADTLSIALSMPGGFQVLAYDGFIVDDTGQKVGVIAKELYQNPELVVPMPAAIDNAAEAHKYKVTLKLYTKDDQQAEQVYEVTLTPPPPPGLLQRIGTALGQTPWIALIIVVVISAVATSLVLFKKKQRRYLPDLRPPVTNTGVNYAAPRRGRLKVRIAQSPGSARGTEKMVTTFPCRIGRGDTCPIRIDDAQLSREHLEITLESGHFFVTDLSRNGTFIGGERLRQGTPTRISGAVSVRLADQTILELDTGD